MNSYPHSNWIETINRNDNTFDSSRGIYKHVQNLLLCSKKSHFEFILHLSDNLWLI